MRDFRFDLQLFATVDVAAATIPKITEDGTYYYQITTSGIVGSAVSEDTAKTTTNYYLKVAVTNGVYTLSAKQGNTTAWAATDPSIFITTLTVAGGTDTVQLAAAATSATAGDANAGTVILNSTSGGTVTDGTSSYTAASGQTVTVSYGTGATEGILTGGSVDLGSSTKKQIKLGNEYIKVTGSGVLSSAGNITGLAANTAVEVGNAATMTLGHTYTVSADGLSISDARTGATGTTDGTYYLTSALKNTVIKLDGTAAGFDTISNGSLAATVVMTVGGIAVFGFADNKTKMYVYSKNGTVFNSGYIDSTLGDQVGVLTPDGNGKYSYDASVAKSGQTITDGAGAADIKAVTGSGYNDSITFDSATEAVTINGGAGKDTIEAVLKSNSSVVGGTGDDSLVIDANGAATTNVFIGGGEGSDVVSVKAALTAASNAWTIDGGVGNDTIDLDFIGANVNEWLVDAGDGNDVIETAATLLYSTIKAGAGNDTIRSQSATDTITGGAGADVFDISTSANDAANIADYTYGTDFIRVDNSGTTKAQFLTDINTVAQTTANMTSEGVLTWTPGTNGSATITASTGYYAVNLVDNTDAKNKASLAWVKDDATTINAASLSENLVLVGTTNTEGDLIVGGSKADTIYAGASDSVYGGAGADAISIGASAYGVYVGVATDSGADTVADFNEGFDIDSADAVYMVNGSIEDATISNDGIDITIKNGKGSLELTGRGSNSTSGVKLLVGDKKVYSIAEGTQLTISDSEELADYFYGTKSAANGSGIDLSNYADDVTVDLSSSMFKNIASVTGGSGNTTLMGSKAAETLFGGTGATSLYGGAGKDSLVSGAGVTTFFLTTGAGKDTVYGFVTGTNEDSSDVLNIFNAGLTGISRSSDSAFTLKVSDTDSLLVNQATSGVDQKIQYASGSAKGVAKIGYTSTANSFSYDEEVTNYLGGSKNDTLDFGSGSDDVNVWLDQTSVYSSIETFDASSRSGSVLLAGTAASETLRGGTGESSLWGGAGNAKDVLVGNSSGTTSFFYGMGQGSDSISGSSNDTMNLYDIQLSDLASATLDTANRRVIFTTTAGDTVSVSGGVQDFVVGGVTYTTTYASDTDWSVKE